MLTEIDDDNFSLLLPKILIKPRVISSENNTIDSIQPMLIKNPTSKIESGKIHVIIVEESIKLFSLSFSLALIFDKYAMTNIMLALTIENENPTNKLYPKSIELSTFFKVIFTRTMNKLAATQINNKDYIFLKIEYMLEFISNSK